jgi:outer membrane protein assembly factor BamB
VAAALASLLLLNPARLRTADWPALGRDSTRNPVSPEKGPPLRWQVEVKDNDKLVQPAQNLKWQAVIGSLNQGSPVVAGGLVWIGTNNVKPRDPKVTTDHAVLMCFREKDGQFLWQYLSPRLDEFPTDGTNVGINCAPLIEGDRLWFTTNRSEVICLDIAQLRKAEGDRGNPRLVWKLDMRKDLGVAPVNTICIYGQTCSIGPSYKGRIYVTTGNGVWNDGKPRGAPQAPSLLCLDQVTGKVLWSDNSPGDKVLEVQWASPLVAEIKGRGQVIVGQGDGWVRSFDALTGKLIWKFDTNPKAAQWRDGRGERNYLVATPVLYDNRVYVANGRWPDSPNRSGRLYCIDPTKEGDVSPELEDSPSKGKPNPKSAAVWCFDRAGSKEADEMHGAVASVAIHDGLLIAPDGLGYVHCLDAWTGQKFWTHDAEDATYATPLIVDGKVYIPTSGGELHILALARQKRLLARHDMKGEVRAPAVFANGVLYVAAGSQLFALQSGGKEEKAPKRAVGHWPQWRGPDRTNVSKETGLLKTWPKDGPPLAWKVQGLGEGVASVAVTGGRVFTLGHVGNDELVTALEETTGKKAWSARLGPSVKENPVMRWLSQRTPTIDGDRLYAMTARGELICLKVEDGKELWRKDYRADFGGKLQAFGWCDRPLVDGDNLICAPGGEQATVVALNKKTGAVVWKCPVPGGYAGGYSTSVVAKLGGVRQYVLFLTGAVIGVSTDGKFLWEYKKVANMTANNYTPIVHGDHVFCASGYGSGIALFKVAGEQGTWRSEEVYSRRVPLPPWHETTVRLGEHVYAGTTQGMTCLELLTGMTVWQERTAGGTVSVTCADDHLYLRNQQGQVTLVEATPAKYLLKGTLQIPEAVQKAGSSAPVVAGGRLFLRDDDLLFCYDVKEGDAKPEQKPEREPDAVFVPTPQDVVEKMLEVAAVKGDDVVCDLGCGDGRIVVTAARKYGCKALGYDIDPECVKLALEHVRKHDVGRLVTIEQKDLFTVDLAHIDVVALYLLPRLNEKLLPQLGKLKPGSRIVSHAFEIPGVKPDRMIVVSSAEDDLEHKVYLWTAPLKVAKGEK